MAYDTLSSWPQPGEVYLPPKPVDDLTGYFTNDQGLVLRWSAIAKDILGLPMTPLGYCIRKYEDYPLKLELCDSLGFTADTVFTVPELPESLKAFFDVRTVR
jgi:hypothetical protein